MAEVARLRLSEAMMRKAIGDPISTDSEVREDVHGEVMDAAIRELSVVREQLLISRDQQLAALSGYESLGAVEAQISDYSGHIRATEFLISVLKDEEVGLRSKAAIDESRAISLSSELIALERENENMAQAVAHAHEALSSIRAKVEVQYPSNTHLNERRKYSHELTSRAESLASTFQGLMTDSIPESTFTEERRECEGRMGELLTRLGELEAHQSQVCDSRMDSLALLMEIEEKRLEVLAKRRELASIQDADVDAAVWDKILAAIPEEHPVVATIDFESTDIEDRQEELASMHHSLTTANAKRTALALRITELRAELANLK